MNLRKRLVLFPVVAMLLFGAACDGNVADSTEDCGEGTEPELDREALAQVLDDLRQTFGDMTGSGSARNRLLEGVDALDENIEALEREVEPSCY